MALLPSGRNKVYMAYVTADLNRSAFFILGKGEEAIENIVYQARAPDRDIS